MMGLGINEIIGDKREAVLAIAARHGAMNVRVFGSVARGEAGPESDIDFLMDLDSETSLFDRVELIQELQELLNRRVDVAKPQILHDLIRDKVISDAVRL
jgi:hypothetical protein